MPSGEGRERHWHQAEPGSDSSDWQHVFFRSVADLPTAWQEGMDAAIRAISLDRTDHRAYTWKGMLLLYPAAGEPRWDDALANLRRANELNSNDAGALLCLGLGEAVSGDPRRGIEHLTLILRLSPHEPWTFNVHSVLGFAHFLAKDYGKALHWASLGNREAPHHPQPYMYFALAYVGLGEIAQARSALDRARQIAPEFIQDRLGGYIPFRRAEDRERYSVFLRIAAGVEDPNAADRLR